MKQICIAFILIISIIGCKDINNSDEIEMKAGYSYYRVTNKTADTVNFFVKLRDVGVIFDLDLKPDEVYVFDVSTVFNKAYCNVDFVKYCYKPEDKQSYDIKDRVLQEIEIHKRD